MTPRQFFELWVRFREEREWQDELTARIECRMTNLQLDPEKHAPYEVKDFFQFKRCDKLLESNKSDDRPAWMIQRENMKTFTAGRQQRNKRINNG